MTRPGPGRSTSTRPTSPGSTRTSAPRPMSRRGPAEGFNKMYGIVHPAEQWESGAAGQAQPGLRPGARARRGLLRDGRLGTAALVRVQRAAAGAVRRPADGAGRRVGVAAGGRRSSTPSTSPCGTRCGLVDLSAFADLRRHRRRRAGRRAVRSPSRSSTSPRAGSSTPRCSTSGAVSEADLTIMRLGSRQVPRGHRRGHRHGGPGKWIAEHLPADGTAALADLTSAWTTLGLWGPRRPARCSQSGHQ